ncbi:MAG: bifunctional nuclease family protein [Chloroflexi bacterium]|nr:bifunctional nuclease family protein [Chloroflexota bacterium]
MIEMAFHGISRCHRTGQAVLLLREKTGERYLPIRLPPKEEQIIAAELADAPTRRSNVYDLLTTAVVTLGFKLEAVLMEVAPDSEVKSSLRLTSESGSWQVEAHPIDALALAFRQGSPILLGAEALETSSFRRHRQDDGAGSVDKQAKGHRDNGTRPDNLAPALRDFLSTLDVSGLGRNI